MSEYRAILVDDDQRDWLRSYVGAHRDAAREAYGLDNPEQAYWDDVADRLAAFLPPADAAGDQPRKRVCATHDYADMNGDTCWRWFIGDPDCRVVDAIVVPLEDAS